MIDILCLSIISFIIYYGCKPSDNRGGTTLWSHVRHSRWCHHDGPSSEGRWRHGIHQTPCILPTFGSPTWTQVFSEDGFHTSSSWVLAIPRKKIGDTLDSQLVFHVRQRLGLDRIGISDRNFHGFPLVQTSEQRVSDCLFFFLSWRLETSLQCGAPVR